MYYTFGNNKERSTESRKAAQKLGVLGEQIASRYLEDMGYIIIDRNYRGGKHEIDIVALDGNELVFVEVKTRSSARFGNPEEAVDPRKRVGLIRAANRYIVSKKRKENPRMDVIAIVINGEIPQIKHIKSAYNVFLY